MQEEVEKIQFWAESWKMSINKEKTKALIVSMSSADTLWDPELSLAGKHIGTVKKYKFLGVTVDSGLRFTEHINNTVRKCTKRINIIKCLTGKDWGQQLENQRKIYLTYVRSCLEYASSSWWAWISPTNKIKLERVQNAALRAIAGLHRTCPIDFLRLECNH